MSPAKENEHRRTRLCSSRVFLTWLFVSVASCLVYAVIAFAALLNKNILPEDLGLQSIPYANVPERYDIRIQFATEYNKSNKSFQGEVNIVFTSLHESQRIYVHKGDNIEIMDFSLRLKDSLEKLPVKKGAYDDSTEIQTFVLSKNTTVDIAYSFFMEFKGKFVSGKGPAEFSYSSERGEKRYGLWFATDSQSSKGLRYLFPCMDSDEFPADFNVVIIRKTSLRSLSNFVSDKTTEAGSNFMEDHYRSTLKMMPVQFALVLCDFQYKTENNNGTKISIYSRSEILSEISFRRTAQFMDPASHEIGKNDAVLIPDVPTIHRPGISLINEKEAVCESKDFLATTSST
ncbi:hypothetical protein Aduo_017824 [Ancylostoma duodenale]